MNKKLEKVQNRVIKQIADNMKSYGFPETIGLVMGIIYYENEPMNLDQLAEKTGMSKTRMSQVLREMVHLNIAEKVYIKGSRKDYYTVETDYYQTFISLFTSNWKEVVSRNINLENKTIHEVKSVLEDRDSSDDDKEIAQMYLDESELILDFYDWVQRLIESFESHEVFNYVPKKKAEK